MERFEDRTVVVTGGNKGIGYVLAERFVSEGARVVTLDEGGGRDRIVSAGAGEHLGAERPLERAGHLADVQFVGQPEFPQALLETGLRPVDDIGMPAGVDECEFVGSCHRLSSVVLTQSRSDSGQPCG